MACELIAWAQMLALDGPGRRWEPRRLRLRLFSAAGRIVRGGRRLRIAVTWPWATQITAAITQLQALAPADQRQPLLRPERKNPTACGTPAHPARQPGHQPRPDAEKTRPATALSQQPRSRKMQAGDASDSMYNQTLALGNYSVHMGHFHCAEAPWHAQRQRLPRHGCLPSTTVARHRLCWLRPVKERVCTVTVENLKAPCLHRVVVGAVVSGALCKTPRQDRAPLP